MISKPLRKPAELSACTMANQKQLLLSTDFSGLGSPEEALKRLGVPHKVVFACERDKYARMSYSANHDAEVFYDDVTTRDNETAPCSDMYVFGFPCQAFSIAGKQLGFEDMRGTLVFNSADYIRKKRPRTFIGENVKGLLSHDGGRTFRTIIDTFAISENGSHNMFHKADCLGYHVFYKVHNTKNFGIPQNRERIFIIGFRDEADALRFQQPKGFPLPLKLKDLLQDNPNGKYFLSDTAIERLGRCTYSKPQINPDVTGTINTKNNSPQLSYDSGTTLIYEVPEKYYLSDSTIATLTKHAKRNDENGMGFGWNPTDGNGVAYSLNTHSSQMQANSNFIKVKEATKQGYAIAELGDSINLSVPTSTTRRGRVGRGQANTLDTQCNQAVVVGNLPGTFEHRTRVYDPEALAPTITTKTGGGHEPVITAGIRIRRLTPRECFRLQGFSDTFFDKCAAVNSDTQLYKQAGNSITVDTIMNIMKQVLIAIGYNL